MFSNIFSFISENLCAGDELAVHKSTECLSGQALLTTTNSKGCSDPLKSCCCCALFTERTARVWLQQTLFPYGCTLPLHIPYMHEQSLTMRLPISHLFMCTSKRVCAHTFTRVCARVWQPGKGNPSGFTSLKVTGIKEEGFPSPLPPSIHAALISEVSLM